MNFYQYTKSIVLFLFTFLVITWLADPAYVGRWFAKVSNAYTANLDTETGCDYYPPAE